MKNNILILYTEYALYLDACLRKLTQLFNYSVHVVRYPPDKNAPFTLSDHADIKFYNRREMTRRDLLQLMEDLQPRATLVAGWIDSDYNFVALKLKNKGSMVVGVVDNQWTGSAKQKFFTLFAPQFLHPRYSHFWIPGITQYEYMRKLGVETNRLMVGYYSADSDLFLSKYQPPKQFLRRFLYVGRLLDIKGTRTLLDCLKLMCAKHELEWEFHIIGNGQYEDEVKELAGKYNNIVYKPFMQPAELAAETAQGGVFVLPSNYDAWGVVVHEFALLGYPLVLSSMVGSRHYFVTPGYNGYHFEKGNHVALATTLKKIMVLPENELLLMSTRSHDIGKTITTEGWAKRLASTIESHYEAK